MSKTKRLLTALLCFALALCLGGESILSAFSVNATEAEQATQMVDLDTTDPLDDLEGAVISGELFDRNLYYYNDEGTTSLLSFLECGFSLNSSFDADYELYFYVYNPKAIAFEGDERDFVSIIYPGYAGVLQSPLKLVGVTKKAGYEGLILKYKIDFEHMASGNSDLLERIRERTPSERVYEIVSLYLYSDSGLEQVVVGNKYTYSGFMAGYGADENAESSLSSKSDVHETLSLDVKDTYFRTGYIKNPAKNEFNTLIQEEDALHSVYFSVPNSVLDKYGVMSAVHASWYDATLKPSIVLDPSLNETVQFVANELEENWRLGIPLNLKNYYILTDRATQTWNVSKFYTSAGYAWNSSAKETPNVDGFKDSYFDESAQDGIICGKNVDYFSGVYSISGAWQKDSSGNFVDKSKQFVSGEDIKKNLLDLTEFILSELEETELELREKLDSGMYSQEQYDFIIASLHLTLDPVVCGKNSYSACLFETVSERREETIKADDEMNLLGSKVTQSFWNKLFGKYSVDESYFNETVEAIIRVTSADVEGTKEEVCKRLFIAEVDYDDFMEYFHNATKNNGTVFLFRYMVSPYLAEDVNFIASSSNVVRESCGRIFQLTANLGFDIIDITFSNYGVETVIPVLMEPMDIFPDSTPSIGIEEEKNEFWAELLEALKVFFGLIVLGLVLMGLNVVMPFLKPVLGVFWFCIKALLEVAWSILTFVPRLIFGFFKRE